MMSGVIQRCLALFLLTMSASGCTKESEKVTRELEMIYAAQDKLSGGREADNAQLCNAYTRLQSAYVAEGNTEQYAATRLFVVTYC